MKKCFLSFMLVALLSSCVPSVDVGRIAQDATNRAVETAISSAINSLVRRAVDRVVGHVFDLLIASAIDGFFGQGAQAEYGENFNLDLYSGRYSVTLGGDAQVQGRYTFEGNGEPENSGDEFSLGVALRGTKDDGSDFTTISLVRTEQNNDSFVVTLIEGNSETGERIIQAGVQFNDSDIVYAGMAELQIDELTNQRISGSFSADNLVSDDATGIVTLTASFDVPINPAGSLFIKSALE